MFQMLSLPYIRRYLASLERKGKHWAVRARDGPTMTMIARETGISRNTLTWLAKTDTASLGKDKIRVLSKIIAEIENGVLEFVVVKGSCRKVAVRHDRPGDKPVPRKRYTVSIGAKGPTIAAKDRPRLGSRMPTMAELWGKVDKERPKR